MSQSSKSPPPNVPDIDKCPRCGNPILIGDTKCTRCGYRVISIEDSLRGMNPTFLAGVGIAIGIVLTVAAIEASEVLQILLLVAGTGLILGASAYLGLSMVFLGGKKRRK